CCAAGDAGDPHVSGGYGAVVRRLAFGAGRPGDAYGRRRAEPATRRPGRHARGVWTRSAAAHPVPQLAAAPADWRFRSVVSVPPPGARDDRLGLAEHTATRRVGAGGR